MTKSLLNQNDLHKKLVAHVTFEVDQLYQMLGQGKDISPKHAFGLEAKAQLLIDLKLSTYTELQEYCHLAMAKNKLFIPENFWQWVEQRQTFCLPIFMHEVSVN